MRAFFVGAVSLAVLFSTFIVVPTQAQDAPRFFCPGDLSPGAVRDLPSQAAHHAARVLRLGPGDSVQLFNGDGTQDIVWVSSNNDVQIWDMAAGQIGQIVNRVGGYDPDLLKGCPRKDAGPMPPRAGDVTMNSDRLLAAMGCQPFRPWPLGDELMPDDRSWHRVRPEAEGGSFQRITEKLYRYNCKEPTR
jgi:hypothetical protein